MNWPSQLDCIIEYGDRNDEKKATLLRSLGSYGPTFGPMAEYETTDGEKFWIEIELFQKCQDEKTIPRIPVEVITKNAEIQEKLTWGQRQVNRQAKQEQTGLIVPDGISV